jgi:cold shock protein
MSETLRGVVKWFNDAKGFGFIEHKSGKDVFVHYSVIIADGFKTLKDGEVVEYELSEGAKGLHASKVVRINQPLSEGTTAEMQVEVLVEKEAPTPAYPLGHSDHDAGIAAEDR